MLLPSNRMGSLRYLLCAIAVAPVFAFASAAHAQPLVTAMVDSHAPGDPATFARMKKAGARVVRVTLSWAAVAPARRPARFNATDPGDPAYHWDAFDREVADAFAAGLSPLVNVNDAPSWANEPFDVGPGLPDPVELGAFARAAARRYSGSYEALPRIRYWQVWNEPNISLGLTPQLLSGRPVAADTYRVMVNRFAASIKQVHVDNLVVAGGLAPFFDRTPYVVAQDGDWGPLSFMRSLLCLSRALRPTCATRVRFDVWSTHPYTSGGPTHEAVLPDDVSLGDLGEMRAVLTAAERAGHVQSRGRVRFWVTEFSWDSNPPDPRGVPTSLLLRWVPHALYQMWRNGVSLVTWFQVRDEPLDSSPLQSGLYYGDGSPKPYLQGFRFPLVAFPRGHGVYVWGRIPTSKRGRVVVQQRSTSRWKTLAVLRSDRAGIFRRTFATVQRGYVRARLAGTSDLSLPFSLRAVPDHIYTPFGGIPLEPPKKKKKKGD
jgi:hypothetical protein